MMSDNLVQCRYNKYHKVKRTKLVMHELDCPDKRETIETCLLNPGHKYPVTEREIHKATCENWKRIFEEAHRNSTDHLLKNKRKSDKTFDEPINNEQKPKNDENQVSTSLSLKTEHEKQMKSLFKEPSLDTEVKIEEGEVPVILIKEEEDYLEPKSCEDINLLDNGVKITYNIKVEPEKSVTPYFESITIKYDPFDEEGEFIF